MGIDTRPLACPRTRLDDARRDRLHFAQVREDARLEIDFLAPRPDGRYAVVSSGGCTALALLGAGAGQVTAVDLNATQNDLVELKWQALRQLPHARALAFLGASATGEDRWKTYGLLRGSLGREARTHWDRHQRAIRAGVLGAGVSERFERMFVALLGAAVHGKRRQLELLATRTLAEQRRFYQEHWNNRRWRLLLRLLLGRGSMERTYDRGFFRHVDARGFGAHFGARMEQVLCELPLGNNYFVHYTLTGHYAPQALPPCLQPEAAARIAAGTGGLDLVDGSLTAWLEQCEPHSIDGFALSNIAEWLDAAQQERLFAAILRAARPGARICVRNFVGWTEIPARLKDRIHVDRLLGDLSMRRERNPLQRRFLPCTVVESAPAPRLRAARPHDNEALVALAAACPMQGEVALAAERGPDFFALTRLEGEATQVAVCTDAADTPTACIAISERDCHLNGTPARIACVFDLKVHPGARDGRLADALSRWAIDEARARLGSDATVLITVLAGNRAMERRLPGGPGIPAFERIGTLRSFSIPLFARRPLAAPPIAVARASAADLEAMAALWQQLAPRRQFTPRFGDSRRAAAAAMAASIERAPQLDIGSFLLARASDGSLLGFLGVWDQRVFKRLRVLRYTRRMRVFRRIFNVLAPLLGTPALPHEGELLECAGVVHACVAPERPDVLRALLREAALVARSRGCGFLNIGLDRADPLACALRGTLAQATDIDVYLSSPRGRYAGPKLDGRPIHHEIVLT